MFSTKELSIQQDFEINKNRLTIKPINSPNMMITNIKDDELEVVNRNWRSYWY
jgi:hypothetical protein